MARNTIQDQTQERQAFLLELFRQQPEISRQDASDSYKEKFGSPLPPRLFNQMKEQVQEELASAAEAEEVEEVEETEDAAEVTVEDAAQQLKAAASPDAATDAANGTAAQPAKAAKPKAGKGAKLVFIDAPKENLEFLGRIVSQLQEAGAANVRVDHSTERWMVLVVDGK
jgi:hypothetical protein